MSILWQLYNEDGSPKVGQGATKDEAFSKGLLHGSSHVWIWRRNDRNGVEVLLQKRAATKRTWPNRLDISAAGHIDLGEDPLTAAVREAREEIGLTIKPEALQEIAVREAYAVAERGEIENEIVWVYLYEIAGDIKLSVSEDEVASIVWKKLEDFETERGSELYIPNTAPYHELVAKAIKDAAQL